MISERNAPATESCGAHRNAEMVENDPRDKVVLRPYRHGVFENVLSPDAYLEVCRSFQRLKETHERSFATAEYDARIISIGFAEAKSFDPILTMPFLQSMAKKFGLNPTYEVDAAVHIHPAGSRAGWIHTDYTAGYFDAEARPHGMVFSADQNCGYTGHAAGAETIRRVRYMTGIYYLMNPDSQKSGSGWTGLYSTKEADPAHPAVLVPPENNTLLVFECSPSSFHRFMGCSEPRHSLIFWLHRAWDEARLQWPEKEPGDWGRTPSGAKS